MLAVLDVVLTALDLYSYVIIGAAILSWLVAFGVVNVRNDFVRNLWNFATAITEPALAPIRRFLPNLGGVDISPVILLLLIFFAKDLILRYVYPHAF
ncbi:MAG: YggT family protein [Hyphomicrobiales bacterium]|nr:YggT family protein [Hyphomicrobiales bacterium]